MASALRRLAVFISAPVLVLSVAACAPEAEPEVQPTLTSTPTPTPAVVALGIPVPSVPATCAELFTSSAFDGRVLDDAQLAADRTSTWANWRQAGFLECEFEGGLTGARARAYLTVTVDPPADSIWWYAGWGFEGDQFSRGVAGEASHAGCHPGWGADSGAYCRAELVTSRYGISLDVQFDASGVDAKPTVVAYLNELVERIASWPPPQPAWQVPVGVLAWSGDCEGEVRDRQHVVRDAVPFALDVVTSNLGPDATWGYYAAHEATGYTACGWFGNVGGSVDVDILPGGAWMHEAGIRLRGEPFALEGALAASVDREYGKYQLAAYIDGSYVSVSVSPPFDSGLDPEPIAVAVIEALVEAF